MPLPGIDFEKPYQERTCRIDSKSATDLNEREKMKHLWLVVMLACTLSRPALAQDPAGTAGSSKIYEGADAFKLAPRNALVIGVATLKDGNGFLSLKNPANDATKVTEALKSVGFATTNLADNLKPEEMTRQNIKKAVYDFALLLHKFGGVGLIYFSGHGVERNGRMYLLPYDAFVEYDQDFEEDLIPISLFYEAFDFADNPFGLIIVDACRDDPWSTHPVASFGPALDLSTAPIASQNVIFSSSVLSGSKALDGSDDLSPYAAAFVDALNQSDEGLSTFFGTIGKTIHRMSTLKSTGDVPVTQLIDGRDFVFVPTIKTFHQEQTIYMGGLSTGNRDVLNDLLWEYSGGYFYDAAKTWLANAPLAPANAATPARVAQLIDSSNLRTGPSLESDVVTMSDKGTRLAVVGELKSQAGSNWFPVLAPGGQDAFVRTDRVRILDYKPTSTTLVMNFSTESHEGNEVLSAESKAKLSAAFGSPAGAAITGVTVAGYKVRGADGSLGDQHQLLARQTIVLEALKEAGFDSSKATLSVKETADREKDNAVFCIWSGG